MRWVRRVTLIEILTVVVALVVMAAVAVPMWRIHELRAHRQLAIDALLALQVAQDRHFGRHANYADAATLGIEPQAANYTFEIKRSGDALSYTATAHARGAPGITSDSRCARLGIDQHGRRFATSDSGEDTSADCWNRK